MALTLNFTKDGVTIPNAYCRVVVAGEIRHPNLSPPRQLEAVMQIKATAADPAFMTQVYRFAPDWSGTNYHEQFYAYLKTLPEWAGATDC